MAESELIKEEYPITVFHASDQTPEEHWLTSDVTKRWTDNPQGVSLKYPYEFVCSRVYTYKDNVNSNTPASQKKGWKAWDVKNIALWAHYGKDATPFKLILENSEDQVYFIKNVVVLDKDRVGTGKITLTGFDGVREITEFNILDNSGKPVNISWGSRNGNELKGSCLYKNGNWTLDLEIIKTFRSGEPSLYEMIVKDCQITLTKGSFAEIKVKDSEGNDSAKTVNILVDNFCKIPIQAKCEEIREAAVSVFKITAVHDINGDGIIGRWNLIPSVRQIRYKEESRNDSSEGKVITVQSYEPENITFSIEYDPLLESPRPITKDSGYTYGIKVCYSGTDIIISDNGTLSKETIAEIAKAGGATAYLYINDPDYSDRNSESIGGKICYEVDSQEIYVSSSIAIEGAPGGSGDYYSLFFDNPTAAIGGDLSYVKAVLTFMHSISPVLLPNLSINGNIVQLPKDRGEQNEKVYTSEYHGIPGLTIKLYFDAYNNYNITFDMPNPPDTELLIPFTTTQDSNTYRATFRLYKSGTITVDRTVSLIGQASRIRNWESGKHYFPVISSIAALKAPGMQNTLAGIGEDEVAYGDFGGENLYCPRFYDIVYYGTPTATGTPMWQAKAYSSTITPTEGTYWTSANQFDFVAANSAYIKNLAADSVQANRILVKNNNNIVAGLIGEGAFEDVQKENSSLTNQDDVIFFAGLPSDATSLTQSNFYITKSGRTSIGGGSGTPSGGNTGLTQEQVQGMIDNATSFEKVKQTLENNTYEAPLKLAVKGNILAEQLTISSTNAVNENIPNAAWFKFEQVQSENLAQTVLSPVLYWNDGTTTYHLDLSKLILIGEGGSGVTQSTFRIKSFSEDTQKLTLYKLTSSEKWYTSSECTDLYSGTVFMQAPANIQYTKNTVFNNEQKHILHYGYIKVKEKQVYKDQKSQQVYLICYPTIFYKCEINKGDITIDDSKYYFIDLDSGKFIKINDSKGQLREKIPILTTYASFNSTTTPITGNCLISVGQYDMYIGTFVNYSDDLGTTSKPERLDPPISAVIGTPA